MNTRAAYNLLKEGQRIGVVIPNTQSGTTTTFEITDKAWQRLLEQAPNNTNYTILRSVVDEITAFEQETTRADFADQLLALCIEFGCNIQANHPDDTAPFNHVIISVHFDNDPAPLELGSGFYR